MLISIDAIKFKHEIIRLIPEFMNTHSFCDLVWSRIQKSTLLSDKAIKSINFKMINRWPNKNTSIRPCVSLSSASLFSDDELGFRVENKPKQGR